MTRTFLAALVAALALVPLATAGDPPPVTPDNIPADAGAGCYYKDIDCGTGSGSTGEFTESPSLYSAADAAAGRCHTRWAKATRKNLFGVTMFQYFEQVRYCWKADHSKITYLYRDRWPADTHVGWSFDGNSGGNCSDHCTGMVGAYQENVWTQGTFHVCIGLLGFSHCNYKYPRVSITVYASGTATAYWTGA